MGGGQGEVGAVRRKVGLQVRLLLLAVLKTFDPQVAQIWELEIKDVCMMNMAYEP